MRRVLRAGAALLGVVAMLSLQSCSDRGSPADPGAPVAARVATPPYLSVPVGAQSVELWPWTTSTLNVGAPDDPINLYIAGEGDPRAVRAALMALGNSTAFGCSWSDAIGGPGRPSGLSLTSEAAPFRATRLRSLPTSRILWSIEWRPPAGGRNAWLRSSGSSPTLIRSARPVLFIHGENDPLNLASGTLAFYEQIGFEDKLLKIYPGSLHETHNDLDASQVAADLVGWIGAHLE